jgi:hypothetical protein
LAILVAKYLLVARINVNWDEFYYLSHVYTLSRGELDLFLQGAYAHAFLWITGTPGGEVEQIVRLRVVMLLLLAASAVSTYLLARQFASRAAAWVALLALLASWPMLKHGASFRADSILLPLLATAFYFLLRATRAAIRDALVAGACFGAAFVVTVKAVLFLPALAAMAVLPDVRQGRSLPSSLHASVIRLGCFAVAAAVLAAILLALHHATLVAAAEGAGTFATRTVAAALLDTPFLPMRALTAELLAADPVYWLAALAGMLMSLTRGAYATAAAALCFTPLLFYRNVFAYFFPVMMAPAAVLVAVTTDALIGATGRRSRQLALATVAVGCVLLLHGAWDGVARLRFDRQAGERAVVAAVHRIFQAPVPYLDHSGMIASFPKANFFMSGWGVENYLAGGRDFMPDALAGRCPPLLLVNHPVLKPGTLLFRGLRPRDRELLASRYVPYWGPVRVAGASIQLRTGREAELRVPCDGRYRSHAAAALLLEGRPLGDGDIVELEGERPYRVAAADPAAPTVGVTFTWAAAGPAPVEAPPRTPPY